jgi:hypothetical protein
MYDTKYHRDGTVTVWDVYQQSWLRCQMDAVPDEVLASLSVEERDRMAARVAARRLGRMGGRARSAAKAAASRTNGLLGGAATRERRAAAIRAAARAHIDGLASEGTEADPADVDQWECNCLPLRQELTDEEIRRRLKAEIRRQLAH